MLSETTLARIRCAVSVADSKTPVGRWTATRREIAREFMDRGLDNLPETGGRGLEDALDYAEARSWRRP